MRPMRRSPLGEYLRRVDRTRRAVLTLSLGLIVLIVVYVAVFGGSRSLLFSAGGLGLILVPRLWLELQAGRQQRNDAAAPPSEPDP